MQQTRRKFYNDPFVGVRFSFVSFTWWHLMPRMHPVFWHILSHALIYIDIYLQECFQPSSVHLCKSTLCFNRVKQPFYHQYHYTFYSMLICTCNTTKTMLSAYMHVWHAVRRVNGWLFHCVNTENEASCQGKRLSKRPSFTSFCASGNDLFFRRGNERDENDVKRG